MGLKKILERKTGVACATTAALFFFSLSHPVAANNLAALSNFYLTVNGDGTYSPGLVRCRVQELTSP